MFSKGTVVNSVMSDPKFQFKNDANETLIENQSHIFFRTDNTCEFAPKIVGLGATCLPVTAQVIDGVTTQSTAFADYDTEPRALGETKKMITIACSTPICLIDATEDLKKFTNTVKTSGINGNIATAVNTSGQTNRTNDTGLIADCPTCGEVTDCVTYIQIANASATAIQGIKFALDFYDDKNVKNNAALKLKSTLIELDGNMTTDYVIDGSTVALTGLDLNSTDGTTIIKVTYSPTETDVLAVGTVQARIFDLDTNTTTPGIDVIYDETKMFASFEVSGLTKFTVPYMNTSAKTFVKITTKSSDAPAQLSAVITDQNGKTVEVTLDDIAPNATVYLFSTFGPLFDAAKAAGLSNAWTVDFTTSAAAVVDSYMTTPNGERRVEVY